MVQNGTPLGEMIIKLGLDTTAFSDSLTGATRAAKTSVREMETGFRVLDSGGKKVDALAYKQEGLTKVISAQQKELGYLKTAYDKTLDSEGKATSTTAKAAQKYNEAQARLSGYEAQLKQTSGQLARYKVETEGITGAINSQSDSLINFGDKLQTVGSGLSSFGGFATKYVTAPLALGMGAVTKAVIDWESSFAGVMKTNDEVIGSNGKVTYSYDDLEGGLRKLATQLPSTHQEIAKVAETAGQLGIQTDNVVEFTKTMIDMSEATNMSAEQASTTFARFANITQMSQKDFDRLGSTVVDLGNHFATTETEITDMSLRLAGAGHQIGMSEAEIMGFSTALSSVGIEAEAGGSAFSKVMINMQLATEQGGDSLKAFSEVAGMTNEEFTKMFKEDPSQAILKFIEGLADAENQGKSTIAILDDMGIKEVRLRDALLRAAGASGVFEDAIKTGNKAWKENTALTEEAEKRYDTTASKLKMLRNEATDAAIEFGGPFVDALRDGLEAAKPMIKKLGEMAKAFSELDEDTQRNIIKWGLFAAALGPVSKGLGGIISLTGKTSSAIGGVGKSIVDLAGKSAEKKAIEGFGTALEVTGTAAAGAGGPAGVGAFTASLTGLSPVLLGIVGAGGALALGYGAWKLWGEEAWNAGQRTKRWGEDVGEVTDKALGKIEGFSTESVGQFSLMENGLNTNVDSMVDNFQKMGDSIEKDMTRQISAFKEAVEMLPEDVRKAGQEIEEEITKRNNDALKIIQDNNAEMSEIKQNAANQNRDITINEAKMIKDLMTESAKEYLDITISDADARKEVLTAMTGNVEEASKEQATVWLKSLGKQRQETEDSYNKQLKDYKKFLDEQGILNTDQGKQLVELFEQSKESSTNAIDEQIAMISNKYPELLDEIYLGNGKLASSLGKSSIYVKEMNEQIIGSTVTMSQKIKESADKNAESLGMMGNQATEAGKRWNEIVLDEKTGEVKTNAIEEVKNASKSVMDWHKLAYEAKDADLSSNAKLVIAEAAIANGHWGSLEFMGKDALIESNATITMIEAAQQKGIWDELDFQEKKALLYSDTPEKVAQAIFDLGLWEELEPDIKTLKADNYEFLNGLASSEQALRDYNGMSVELKTLLADGPAKMTYEETKKALDDYEVITPALKGLYAQNEDAIYKFSEAQAFLSNYERLNPGTKILTGNSSDVINASRTGENSLNSYNLNNPFQKNLLGNSTSVINSATSGERSLNSFDANNPGAKSLVAYDDASYNADTASNSVERFWRLPDFITKTLNVVGDWLGFEKGTDYHPGGMAMVNDQKGPMYKELVTLPNGHSFIPEGRDVLLPLPRGSKVLPANKTRQMFPRYAGGVGVPVDTPSFKQMTRVNTSFRENSVSESSSSSAIQQIASELTKHQAILERLSETQVKLLKGILNKNTNLIVDDRVLAHATSRAHAIDELVQFFD